MSIWRRSARGSSSCIFVEVVSSQTISSVAPLAHTLASHTLPLDSAHLPSSATPSIPRALPSFPPSFLSRALRPSLLWRNFTLSLRSSVARLNRRVAEPLLLLLRMRKRSSRRPLTHLTSLTSRLRRSFLIIVVLLTRRRFLERPARRTLLRFLRLAVVMPNPCVESIDFPKDDDVLEMHSPWPYRPTSIVLPSSFNRSEMDSS